MDAVAVKGQRREAEQQWCAGDKHAVAAPTACIKCLITDNRR